MKKPSIHPVLLSYFHIYPSSVCTVLLFYIQSFFLYMQLQHKFNQGHLTPAPLTHIYYFSLTFHPIRLLYFLTVIIPQTSQSIFLQRLCSTRATPSLSTVTNHLINLFNFNQLISFGNLIL